MGPVLLLVEVSRSHSDTRQSVGLLWMNDRPVAKTSTRQHTILTMSPTGLQSSIPASQRPQTDALDRAAQNNNKTNK